MTGEHGAPYVFISYASADRARVLPVVAALRAARVPVWLDEQGIAGGENYALEIAEAIERCAALVLMCSATSLASRNVRQEVALGWRYERPYVPLLLEPVTIPREMAYWLEAAQWVEVLDKPAADWLPRVLAALAPHGIAPAPSDAPREELPGREREQAQLRERLDATLAGRGGLVLVGGEAGVGKTTLTEALLAEAEARGALVLTGRCYDLTETPPYGPWLEITARYPADPDLPPRPAVATDRAALRAVASQAALFDEVFAWFAAVAAAKPLILLLDDLHWADPASLDLLRFVARGLGDLPLLLLATYRSDELTRRHPLYQLLPALAREARATRLDLGPLDDGGIRGLVAARYPLPPGDAARLAAYLQERAEGNPFYAGELLRALEEARTLRADGGNWQLGDLAGVRVPASLRQVLDARLARLGDEAVRLLGVAAVIGQVVPHDLWATVAGADEATLLDAIERATEAHLLTESPTDGGYRFAHALIREALYDGILLPRRRAWHRRAGEALAAQPRPDPDAVAHHFRHAGDERAAEWLERAGVRAQRAYAWLTAAARFEAALALLEQRGATAGERGWLLLRLARLVRYADAPRGVALLDEALRLAEDGGDAPLAACARTHRGLLRCIAGNLGGGVADLAAGADALDALPAAEVERLQERQARLGIALDRHLRGTLVLWLAVVGRHAEALAMGARVAADPPPPGAHAGLDDSPHADAWFGLGIAHGALGRPDEAHAAFARARALFRAIGHHFMVVTTHASELNNVTFPYAADDPAARRRQLAEIRDAFTRTGGMTTGPSAPEARLKLGYIEGRWEELAQLVEAIPAALRESQSIVRLGVLQALGALALARGEGAQAHDAARGMLDMQADEPGGGNFAVALAAQRLSAAVALQSGDLPAAHDWLVRHDRWLGWSGAVLWRAEGALGWVAYYRAAGDRAHARHHAEMALAHASEPRQPLALLAANRAMGELDTEAGHHTEAAAHLDAALALAEACQVPYERALTLLARAELHTATGDHPAAQADLNAARAICEPLGAKPALARADALAARLATPT